MKKLLSTNYSELSFNISLFLLRVVPGLLILADYGYGKLVNFSSKKDSFMNFMGIGSTTSLALVIFAEFFCAFLLIIGLINRLTVIPLVITMAVVVFKVDHGNIFGRGTNEIPALYLCAFTAVLLLGPGKFSVDGAMGK
ncbi:MAG: DoxX family protein [Sphingobacteriales bacterium]